MSSGRAQSEIIGVILLVGVVVTLVFIGGAAAFTTFSDGTDRLFVDVDATATTQNVTLSHGAGDNVPTDDLTVILRAGDTERYDFASFTQLSGNDGTQFEQGDTWYRGHGLDGDRMEILLVHEPSNSILDRTTVNIEETLAARIDTSPSNPTTLSTIEFNASSSVAKDSEITSYAWELGDGTSDSGEVVTHSYDDAGTYDITLTVDTADGRTTSTTTQVDVANPTPVASFTYDPGNPGTGEETTFDGSGSDAPGSTIDSYEWDFDGDGTTDQTGEVVTTSFGSYGTYDVTLIVTDQEGETATTTKTVTVEPPFFNVTIDGTNSPVAEGETLSATVTVENTGNDEDTQTIELTDFGGTVVDSESLTIGKGESTGATLDWDTNGVDPGTGEITVTSENDTATASVEIEEQGDPNISTRIDDLTNADQDKVLFLTSVDVTNVDQQQFSRVEIEATSDNGGSDSGTISGTRGSVDLEPGYGAGSEFNITISVIYEDNTGTEFIAGERTVTTTANAENPVEEDLSQTTSPTLDSSTIIDESVYTPAYRVSYDVGSTAEFAETRAFMVGKSGGGFDDASSTNAEDTVDLDTYGIDQEFKIAILVVDTDNTVVASRTETDTASETMAGNTRLVSSTASKGPKGGPDSELDFTLENRGDMAVEIDGISVDATSSSATTVDDERPGGGGPGGGGQQDISFLRTDTDETLRTAAIPVGGGEQSIQTTSFESWEDDPEFVLRQFRDGNGNQIDMAGETATVTLYFTDGTSREYELSG